MAALSMPAVYAQEAKKDAPKGRAIVNVFTNFHSGFGRDNDYRGFELDRSYLGYQYDCAHGLSVKAVMDIGRSDEINDYHRIAYVKNAQLTWRTGNWTINGGLISTTQFNTVEKYWGYRYIYRSFQDHYRFGSSADLGLSAAYKVADWLSVDGILVNGEGYKRVQVADGLMYGIGATLIPLSGLSLRLYAGLNEQVEEGQKDIMNYAFFAGYKGENFSLWAEYCVMENAKGIEDRNQSGFSVYGKFEVKEGLELFARFDNLSSKGRWNRDRDESVLLAGAQWLLGKYVKIAPNFRMTMPDADGAENRYAGYVSCFFGL